MRRLLFLSAALLAFPVAAQALSVERTQRSEGNAEIFGVAIDHLAVGAGYGNYTADIAPSISPGVTWSVRADLDTSQAIDTELHYVGAVNGFEAGTVPDNFNLYTNGVQLAAKLNPITLNERITPYLLGGVGLTRMSVARNPTLNAQFQSDTATAIPVALGAEYAMSNTFFLGARAQYDFMFDAELEVANPEASAGRLGIMLNLGATNF